MKISLEHTSKKFQRYWIFKDINYNFTTPGAYALLGANGSGKSTLMRVIAGIQNPSKGKVHFEVNNQKLDANKVFPLISYCAPGMEIVEELTLKEFLDFHFTFKKPLPGISVQDIINIIGLETAANKPISDYSSGMKQRVKLAQAIFSDTPVVLLDEPCTNLDEEGTRLYSHLISHYCKNRVVIVSSNDSQEYGFCEKKISILDYK